MTVVDRSTQYHSKHAKAEGPPPDRRLRDLRGTLALPISLLVIGLLHVVNINGWPSFSDDEGTYVAQAWAMYQGHLAHYTYWYDHPPVGWLQLAALMGLPRLTGLEPSVMLGRFVMVGYALATATLIYRLCRNLGLRQATGVAAMLLWGLSPLVVFEGRQVMLDNIALPWVLGSFVLASERRRTLACHIAAGLCFGVAVLTKETMVLIAPALLVLLWRHAYRPTRLFSVIGAGVTVIAVVCIYPLYALLKYELLAGPGHVSLQDAIAFQLLSRTGSGNVLDSSSGARGIVDSWLFYDSILPITGVLAGLGCLFLPRLRAIGVAMTLFVAIALRPNGYMPGMFIIGVLPFAAVALAGVGEAALGRLGSVRWKSAPLGALVVSGILVAAGGFAVPRWLDGDSTALTADVNDPYYAALDYMDAHLQRSTRILADDSYWTSLVDKGWSGDGWDGPIWYTKLDLDPIARQTTLGRGWQDVDYLLISEAMLRSSHGLAQLPQLRAAYDHSAVVGHWGTGTALVQLRKITAAQSVAAPSQARIAKGGRP